MKMMHRIFSTLLFSFLLNVCSNNLATAQIDSPDPIIGTWELNQAESSQSDNAPPPNWTKRTEIYRMLDDAMMEMESSSVLSNGTSGSGKASWDAKGGIVLRDGQAGGSEIIIQSRLSTRQWLVTQVVNGVQVSTRLKIISEDGNRMVQTFKELDNQNMVYEKQTVFYKQ